MRKYPLLIILGSCVLAAVLGLASGYAYFRVPSYINPLLARPSEAPAPADTPQESDASAQNMTPGSASPTASAAAGRTYKKIPRSVLVSQDDDITETDRPDSNEAGGADNGGHNYVLSVFEGYVAVFYSADNPDMNGYDSHISRTLRDGNVKEVTNTPVSALSADEKRRLTDGIKVSDDEQLAKILQDYGS